MTVVRKKIENLYYYNWFTDVSATPAMVEEIFAGAASKEHALLLSCEGALRSCWKNPIGSLRVCARCRFWKKAATNRLPPTITELKVDDVQVEGLSDVLKGLEYSSLSDIKQLGVKGAWVGWAALSTYISLSRCSAPTIDSEFRSTFGRFLAHAVHLALVAEKILEDHRVDVVTLFNGRTSDTRPVYDLARARGIDVRSIEILRDGEGRFRRQSRLNALPQDIDETARLVNSLWQESNVPVDQREFRAAEFFEGRRAGSGTRDRQSWTAAQKRGQLPNGWSNSHWNVVFFTSSAFEIAGIKELQDCALFQSQVDAIDYIASCTRGVPGARLIIRVHPNEKNGNDPIELWYREIEDRYAHVTVESSASATDTYALMDAADLIVTSSSSVGIEASYWGKAVILTGSAGYAGLEACYVPASKEELARLLTRGVPAKSRSGSVKYAYWLMAVEERTLPINDRLHSITLRGRKISLGHDSYSFWGSRFLFWIMDYFIFRILSRVKVTQLHRKEG